jgi:CarD family transcriptional regulator
MTTATQPLSTPPHRRFDVGDRVVHPRHGAGEVVERRQRVVEGSARDYLEIELATASLRIMVPCDAAASVGLRPVVGPRRVREIVEVLEAVPEGADRNYTARRKHYREQLEGGDVLALAAVIRDLATRAAASPLPTGERDLYQRSRQVLASELSYALGVDSDGAGAFIDEHIDGACDPALRRTA